MSDSTIRGGRIFLLSVQGILERAFVPRKNNKQEGDTTMKRLLLIALMAGGLAFVPVQRSDAQISVGIGYSGYGYGYYPYGYYRPYRYYGYYSGPSYYWSNGHRYYRHHRHHHYYRY